MDFVVHSLKPGTDAIDGIHMLRNVNTSDFLLHFCAIIKRTTGSDVRAYLETVRGKRVL